jgi:hypothetical protein
MTRPTRLFLPLLALTLSTLSGCVTYHGSELPSSTPVAEPLARRATRTYAYQVNGKEISSDASGSLAAADRAVADAGALGPGAPEERLLRVSVVNNEHSSFLLAYVSGLTIFLFPAWWENEITVTGTVLADTKVVRTAEAKGTVKTFLEFFFVFALPFNNWSATEETIKALTAKVCTDLAAK